MPVGRLFQAAANYLSRGLHRNLVRRIPKPINPLQTAGRIVSRFKSIVRPDARKIVDLISEGVQAAEILMRQPQDQAIDPEVVPENEYIGDQLPLGDRYVVEVEVDIFDEDGDLIKTIPITTTVSEGTTPEDVDDYADEVIEGYYRDSPTMFGGASLANVTTVKRQILYAERAF